MSRSRHVKMAFAKDVDRFFLNTRKKQDAVVRDVAFNIAESVMVGSAAGGVHPVTKSPGTPVDTSFARNSWWVSLGTIGGGPPLTADKRAAKDEGRATLAEAQLQLALVRAGPLVYFLNNASYILPLEYGHSKQAPAGFLRMTVKSGQALLNAVVANHRGTVA